MGHKVDTVPNAETAVDKLNAGVTYDVILTDVRMPGMSGVELRLFIIEKMPVMKNRYPRASSWFFKNSSFA
ncbi:MAG: response regulator [Dehalococcoidales bacterium]